MAQPAAPRPAPAAIPAATPTNRDASQTGIDGRMVGRVLGTSDATPLQFWVAVAPGSYLQLDDVVVTSRELPDEPPVTIAGVVTAVRARHAGAPFRSDRFA